MNTMTLLCCNTIPTTIEIKDWITLISVFSVIFGWFVNGYLNRKNEIDKKRLDHVLPTLKSFLKVPRFIEKNPAPFSDPTFLPLIEEVRIDFFLLCLVIPW